MAKPILKISLLFVLLILLSIQGSTGLEQKKQIQSTQRQFKNEELSRDLSLNPNFGKIPLYFIPNEGQVDERALFYAKASRYTLWLTKEGLVFDSTRRIKKENNKSMKLSSRDVNNPEDFNFDRDVSRLVFVNANRSPEVIPVDVTEYKVNYFIGKDKSKWQTNIQTSRGVLYKELYPNIDLKVYGIEKQIEYDFVVKPGGEVSEIIFAYQNIEKTRIDKEGNLVIKTEFGELEHAKPLCYQVIGGEKEGVKAEFKKIENNTYGFKVEDYNKNYELIIDPVVLVYSTFLGGSGGDTGDSIAVDSSGAIYVAGNTSSLDFPTKDPIQESNAGGRHDAFIAKINSSGDNLIYSTYLGGSDQEYSKDIAVDSDGMVYVLVDTTSVDFPTKNPIQKKNGGGYDTTITKINATGSALVFSTYLGGNDDDAARGLALDSKGAAYVTGETFSTNFPTKNPISGGFGGASDVFITKINSSGSALVYSTFLGGRSDEGGDDITLDSEGAVYVTGFTSSTNFPIKNPFQGSYAGGYDTFITKINVSGSALVYSTYLGGNDSDQSYGIAVDSEGAAYVVGWTFSSDFPTKNPIQGSHAGDRDAFIVKINSSGNKLLYSTYLGGSEYEWPEGIAVDSEGAAYVIGNTRSVDFPIHNPIQGIKPGLYTGAFITKVDSSGSALVYSTYLGGSEGAEGNGIAVDAAGVTYVTGGTGSVDFPTKNPLQKKYAGGGDVFIAKIGTSEGIRIVSWNILDYPDMNEEPREEYFRSLLNQLDPDILVVQEMASSAGVNQFLKEVLNHKPPRLYKAASFFDGPDTDNALFFKKAKIGLISRQQIPTSFRDITEYKMKIKKGAAKGTKFKVYSVNFKEGAGAKKKREGEALTLRTYLDGLLPDELFLVCGSFNMMSSTEKAFKILTGNQVNNNGRLMDPIHKTGKWHDKSKHKRFHTESTRKSKFGGGKGGGLDDRFDMILIAYGLEENEKLIYSEGSCCIFGNDGKHLNKAVNKPKNKIVSPEIADALYMASDHLPVIIDLVPQDESK
jgi:endonuclease/exonuclease/phosphatase family metal-dependent hydrolase